MAGVPMLDVVAGLAAAGVGVVALLRGLRPLGLLLLVTAGAWFAGSWWPSAGVLHRVPLVLALVIAAAWPSRRAEGLLLGGIGAAAALSVAWPSVWTTLALGVALAAASHVLLSRGSSFNSVAPGMVYGYSLVAIGALRGQGASATVTVFGYSMAVLAVSVLLLRSCASQPALDAVVRLAAEDIERLSTRLRVLLGDPLLELELGDRVPTLLPATTVLALKRHDAVVGYLRHSRDRRPGRRLVDGLGELAGLLADARALRAHSLTTLAEVDAAHQDFQMTRARTSAELGRKLRSGPVEHLARARSRLSDPALVAELDRAREELESVSEGLADLATATGNWCSALARRIDLCPIPVSAHLAPNLGEVPERVGHQALLGCSEALSNAAKHSGAKSIRLSVALADRMLHVEVADDGVGGAHPSGFGLRGIRERTERLGGGLELRSRPGAGTVVRFWLPCQEGP